MPGNNADVRNPNRRGVNSGWTPEERELFSLAVIRDHRKEEPLDLDKLAEVLGRSVKTLKDRAVKIRAELRDEGLL